MKMLIKILLVLVGLLLLILLVGLVLPKERIVTRTGNFPVVPQVLYSIVTDNYDWQYRTSLKDLVILEDNDGIQVWDEYTTDGSVIRFSTREMKQGTFYSFDMESKLFTGYWEATFEPTEDRGTTFTATEHIRVKNPFMKTLSYLFFNVGKIMDGYQDDLRAKVESLPDISMTMKLTEYKAGTETIELTVTNYSNEEIFTDAYYELYRETDGKWERLPLELAFIDIAYILPPGDARNFTIRLPHDQYAFIPGRYRVSKKVNGQEMTTDFILIP